MHWPGGELCPLVPLCYVHLINSVRLVTHRLLYRTLLVNSMYSKCYTCFGLLEQVILNFDATFMETRPVYKLFTNVLNFLLFNPIIFEL